SVDRSSFWQTVVARSMLIHLHKLASEPETLVADTIAAKLDGLAELALTAIQLRGPGLGRPNLFHRFDDDLVGTLVVGPAGLLARGQEAEVERPGPARRLGHVDVHPAARGGRDRHDQLVDLAVRGDNHA